MPFPDGTPTTRVHYTVKNPAGGRPASRHRQVTFAPTVPAVVMPGEQVTFTGSGTYRFNRKGQLVDPEGAVGVRLLPNDLPGCNPTVWYWQVVDKSGDRPRTYTIHLSVDQPVVDLTDAQEVDPGAAEYVPVVGPAGISAYQSWLNAGNEGGEEDFLASLVGPPGARGSDATMDWSIVTPQAIGADPAGSAALAKQTAVNTATSHTVQVLAEEVQRSDAAYEPTGAAEAAQQQAVTAAEDTIAAAVAAERARADDTYDLKGSAAAALDTACSYTDGVADREASRADAAYEPAGSAASALQQLRDFVQNTVDAERARADAAYQPHDPGAATPTVIAYVDTAVDAERVRSDTAYDPAGAAEQARQAAAAHATSLVTAERQLSDRTYDPAGAAEQARQASLTEATAYTDGQLQGERQRADTAYEHAGAGEQALDQARTYVDGRLTQATALERAVSDSRYDPAGTAAAAQDAARTHTVSAVQGSVTAERAVSDQRYDRAGAATDAAANALTAARTYTDQQAAGEKNRADAAYDPAGAAANATTAASAALQSAVAAEKQRADTAYAAAADARLTDARTPKPHGSSHAVGGSDPVTPASIGAATASTVASLTERLTAVENRAASLESRRLTGVLGKTTAVLSLAAGATAAIPVTFDTAMPSTAYLAVVQVDGAQNLLGTIQHLAPVTNRTITGCTVTVKNTGLLTLAQPVTVQVAALLIS